MNLYVESSGKIFDTDLSVTAATNKQWRLPSIGSRVAVTSGLDGNYKMGRVQQARSPLLPHITIQVHYDVFIGLFPNRYIVEKWDYVENY